MTDGLALKGCDGVRTTKIEGGGYQLLLEIVARKEFGYICTCTYMCNQHSTNEKHNFKKIKEGRVPKYVLNFLLSSGSPLFFPDVYLISLDYYYFVDPIKGQCYNGGSGDNLPSM